MALNDIAIMCNYEAPKKRGNYKKKINEID
jgi:hypothetical protein